MYIWGIEARLNDFPRPRARLVAELFRVIELRPEEVGAGWSIYWLRKEGISTRAALRRIARAMGAEVAYAGMKDSWGVSYQYVALRGGRPQERVEAEGVRAWRLREGGRLSLGAHGGNIFKVVLETEDPEALESNLKRIERIPSFYGPQRFGIGRPSTHLYGLALARGDQEMLIRELSAPSPLSGEVPGEEMRALKRARELADPWALPRDRLYLEALQSYIFNRALSKVIRRLEDAAERRYLTSFCGAEVELPAVSLPAPSVREGIWGEAVREVLYEEGIGERELRGLRPAPRPLYYPVRLGSIRREGARLTFTLCLPPSAYATVLLMEVADIELPATSP